MRRQQRPGESWWIGLSREAFVRAVRQRELRSVPDAAVRGHAVTRLPLATPARVRGGSWFYRQGHG